MAHDHAHHHHSHHAHAASAAAPAGGGRGSTERALIGALVLNGGFLVVEAALGFFTGSLALLSDAAHMLSDVGALALALGATWLARGAASPGRSYGWLRAETLGAFTNAVLLLVVCGFIFKEAVERLLSTTPEVAPWPVVAAGALGLLINLGSAWSLYQADRGNLNIRAALAHMLADALGSVGAIASGLFLYAGYPAADPLVSLFIGALVLWGTISVLRDAARVLLQFAPGEHEAEEVLGALRGLEGAADVHDLHVWTVDGRTAVLSAHLVAAPGVSTDGLRRAAESLLSVRFSIGHSTLQVESSGESACANPCCPLVPRAGA